MEPLREYGSHPRANPKEDHPPEGIHSIMFPSLECHICFIIPNKCHNGKILLTAHIKPLPVVHAGERLSAVLDEVKVTDDSHNLH